MKGIQNRNTESLIYGGADLLDNAYVAGAPSSDTGPLVVFGVEALDLYTVTPLALKTGDACQASGDLISFEEKYVSNEECLSEPLLPSVDSLSQNGHPLFRYWNTKSVRKFYSGIFSFLKRRNRNDAHEDSGHPVTSQHTPNNYLDDTTVDDTRTSRQNNGNSRRRRASNNDNPRQVCSTESRTLCSRLVMCIVVFFLLGMIVRHEIQCNNKMKKSKKSMYPQVQRLQNILSCAAQLSFRTINELESPDTPQGKAVYWFLVGAARYLPVIRSDGMDYCNSQFAQLYSLIVFRDSVQVPYPKWYTNQTLKSFDDICSWPSVSCSGDKKYITNLTVNHENLTGIIPDELWSGYGLTQLQSLALYSNPRLHGTIPTSISRFSDTLVYLSLSGTGIYGKIPSEIGQLTRLEELHLADTQLTGTLPTSICNLPRLRNLQVDLPCTCSRLCP